MRMVEGVLLVLLLAASPAAADPVEPGDPVESTEPGEPVERESEFELAASEAWRQPGFRVELRLGGDRLAGAGGSPDARGFAFAVAPGIRLSDHFSVAIGLRYTALTGQPWGLRYGATGELIWHVWDGFYLAAGAGHAGMAVESWFDGCNGQGVTALARTGWLFALGEVFATGPALQWDQQWTFCEEQWSSRTARWQHSTFHASWSFAWR